MLLFVFYLVGCICAVITAKYANIVFKESDFFYTSRADITFVFFVSWASVIILMTAGIVRLCSRNKVAKNLKENFFNWFEN